MARQCLLKEILEPTRYLWDRPTIRAEVRDNFLKIISCGTAALGWELYTSATETKYVFHTCKSRFCPSCGYRRTLQWGREQDAALPDIAYCGIVFTMPGTLWGIFKRNRHLLHDLPALGAGIIQDWAKIQNNIKVMALVAPHTFGGDLQFNAHLHILVSAGGLHHIQNRWVAELIFDEKALMRMWRNAVITHLSAALEAGVLKSTVVNTRLRRTIVNAACIGWKVLVDKLASKSHFVRYAFRYIRRAPIAERHILCVTDQEVRFNAKNTREKKREILTRSLPQFVELLAQHVPDRYRHGIRRFGLLSPRTKGRIEAAMFLALGQTKLPRPGRLGWRASVIESFGTDPLIDGRGDELLWAGRGWNSAS